ncbi:hypothetical protein, partial [Klebsiella pneumoniae]|uniref:hypothetical protein n=1 Tax=Klebsiella pneumoniae TaxID=573 RepID=UPI003970C2B7
MVGLDGGDPDFNDVEETGGAKTVAATGTVAAPTISGSTANESSHTHGATGLTFSGDAVAAASTNTTPDLVAADI